MKKVIIHAKNLGRIKAGHPWIYRSQVKEAPATISSGELVRVFSERDQSIGIGFFNPKSEISIRLLTNQNEKVDKAFFENRIKKAIAWRKNFLKNVQALRWINSESDGLPGLIVDEYAGYLILQNTTSGMELLKQQTVEILTQLLNPKGIYERNDFLLREAEGLPSQKGCLYGEAPPELILIEENKTSFWVNVIDGHKTGFYLDQRDNRIRAGQLAKDKDVLDCFSYTGGFAVSCLAHGAKSALAIESSEEALAIARKNAELNGVQDRWKDIMGNGFDYLKSLSSEGSKFDLIILDPPSFTRRKDSVERALAGYKEINLRALKMLRDEGILISASCSHHIQEALFREVITEAASDTKRKLTLIHQGTQSLDHPILLSIPETYYLKCLFFQVSSL